MSPEASQILLFALFILVVIWNLYLQYRERQEIIFNPPELLAEVEDARLIALELHEVATIAVQAAEQLKNTGKLPNNDAAFHYALSYVRKWIPLTQDIDNEDIVTAIESAVFLVNTFREQVKD